MSMMDHMDVSKNSGTPKSSILIGFSIINHPFWGTPIFGNTHISTSENEAQRVYYRLFRFSKQKSLNKDGCPQQNAP